MNVDLVGAPALAWCRGRGRATRADRVKPALVVTLPDRQRRKCRGLFRVGKTDRYGHFTLHSLRPDKSPSMASADVENGAYLDPDA